MRALGFNEAKITIKYVLQQDNFVTDGSHESYNDKNHVLGISADS